MGTDVNHSLDLLTSKDYETRESFEDLETFTSVGFKMLVEAIKKSNSLPSGKIRDLYESYPSFHSVIEKQGNHVLSVLTKMMKQTNCHGVINKKDNDEKFEMVVDSNDALLENVGVLLDRLSGVVKNPEAQFAGRKQDIVNSSWNNKKVINKAATQVLNKILNQTRNIEKPQLKFKDKINNDLNTPFEPRINYKYNMLKPLACISEIGENGVCEFSHPYEFELEKFKPLQDQMKHQPLQLYKSLKETPLVLINTPEDVSKMVNDLENYKEIAVDLEHHSYRSFQGFTCLMQISTRDTDYIIDTLSLRSDLEILNKIFTDPTVVKVFHGADLDVLWLQRDLALYVVNMFDTHQAAKMLKFPKLSLGYLLSQYCTVNAQKQFQLADWRVRPLPEELLTYAREDTHYLLYIYDNLRNALIEKANFQTNLLESVISESTRICLKRYVKPTYEIDGYLDLYHRSKKLFDNRQKYALQQLFKWRDTIAREYDESYAYVLPDHMMLNISEVLPREAQGILACCNPIPAPVRQHFLALHQIILKAREQPLIKPILEEQSLYRLISSVNSCDNPLQCPHDLNHEGEFRDDLPTLFTVNDFEFERKSFSYTFRDFSKPLVDVFENKSNNSEKMKLQLVEKKVIHLTPYHRYKLSKKFSESVEIKCLSENDGQKLNKEQRTTFNSTEEEGHDKLDKTFGKTTEMYEKDCINWKLNKKMNEINSSTEMNTIEIPVNTSRSIGEDIQTNKPKKEINIAVSNCDININLEQKTNTEVGEKKKKRKISLRKKHCDFEPFNYKSVDFKQYKNSEIASSKKARKKFKIGKKQGKRDSKCAHNNH